MGNLFSKRFDPVAYLNKAAMEEIFEYLSDKDLARCALVCKRWEQFIRTSSICMRKFELKFHNLQWLSKTDFEILLDMKRNYSAISISNVPITSRLKVILAKYKWKSVKLCNLRFPSELEFVDFLGLFEPSVERIGFKTVKIAMNVQHLEVNYIFPKLRHLEMVRSSRFIYKKMFRKCSELNYLSIDLPCTRFTDEEFVIIVNSIQSMMIRNTRLQVLHLGVATMLFNDIFTEDFVLSVQFKVRALKFHRFRRTQQFRNSRSLANAEIFLLNQAMSLEKIHLETCLGFGVLNIIYNEMKRVKTVIIKDLHEYGMKEDIEFLSLKPNTSIVNLNIQTFARYHEIFDLVLKASPNIKTLRMFAMSQQVLNILAQNHHQLEYLYLDCITADEPIKVDAFIQLKFICAQLFISKKFREIIEATPSSKRTNFDEKLINYLKEFKRFLS